MDTFPQTSAPLTSPLNQNPAAYPVRNSTSTLSKRKRNATENASNAAPSPRRARKTGYSGSVSPTGSTEVIDLTSDSPVATPTKQRRTPKTGKSRDSPGEERRARRFRKHAPMSVLDRLARAVTQRMFVVGHTVKWIGDNPESKFPQLDFNMVGTTGNIYRTEIGKVPTCNCPDAEKGNHCKHICYVLVQVLKAPEHLQYQAALLSTELHEIYTNSPLSREQPKPDDATKDGNRKPIEGDCPICFMEFEPSKEEIVWCRAACGNNIHKACFQKWAATQRSQGVRCVYCRSPWQDDASKPDLQELMKDGVYNEEGYMNVADRMGLSGERDYSTYHRPWAFRRSFRSGWHSGWRDWSEDDDEDEDGY